MRFILLVFSWLCLSNPAAAFCEVMIRHYEKQHDMPDKLLQAVAIAESGRTMPDKGLIAWPWTINAEGKAFVFDTKAEVINKVRELQAQGVRSIDVGCMQINLKHHPNAFANLEEAFEPQTNIAYAAQFLKQKKLDQGDWYNAVAHYHSATPSLNTPYKNRVMQIWDRVRDTATTIKGVFTPTPFRQVRTMGRRVPTNIKFAAPGKIKRTNYARPTADKSFFHIKQKGEVGRLRHASHHEAVVKPVSAITYPAVHIERKFFKLTR